MEIPFYKFDGAGNDFVVIDNRNNEYTLTQEQIARMCHRRFGIGADGLMTLEGADSSACCFDFEMKYYNSDGRLGSMCGNGGRCIAAFAHLLGLGCDLHFLGYDGPHDAHILQWDETARRGMVKLGMRSVAKKDVRKVLDGYFIDTGSPHYVQQVVGLSDYDVFGEGRRLRYRADLFSEGTNVDFIETMPDGRLAVRTYERGVEDETWACGTGVTACALVTGNRSLVARGGDFNVNFESTDEAFEKVFLTGPVALDFTGVWRTA